MKKNCLYILYFLICYGILSCKEPISPEPLPTRVYSFFIAGHTYGAPGMNNIGVHPPFQDKFSLITKDSLVEFGVFTGDMVLNPTTKDWEEIDDDVDSLGIPVYFAAGNHDLYNRTLFENRYGPTYFSLIHRNDLIIVLDPTLDGWSISGDQLTFLKTTLEEKADLVDRIYIFCHQLIWWTPDNVFGKLITNSKEGRKSPTNYWTEVEPLLQTVSKPVWIFAGDLGAISGNRRDSYMYYTYDHITLIASGMGNRNTDNFVIIDVYSDNSIQYRLIALNGDDINALGKLEDYMLPE